MLRQQGYERYAVRFESLPEPARAELDGSFAHPLLFTHLIPLSFALLNRPHVLGGRLSAGKNASIASSASVMSTAVPNVEIVLKNASSLPPASSRSGTAMPPPCAGTSSSAGIGADLLVERGEALVARDRHLAPQAVEQVGAPLREVEDPRRHPLRVQRHPQHVDRRLDQVRGNALVNSATLRLAAARFHQRSTTTAGYGSWPFSMRSSASRTGAISGASIARSA